tara:strand:- start:426 stop:770 length:345 start_codon:yes stop_codon:yes gene_type:complete
MGKNWDKLKGHSDVKQDINRRNGNGLSGKEAIRLNKRINDISKVISDPDVWNVNIGSRERMDEIEGKLDDLIKRMDGISYIMKNLINNRKLTNEDVQTHLDRNNNDNSVSGSTE